MARYYIYILFLLLISQNQLSAQSVIEGLVTDDQGLPIGGCVVFLLHDPSMLLADNTLTEVNGSYRIKVPKLGSYVLEFRNVAFMDTLFKFDIDSFSTITKNISLNAQIFDLQSVEIVDRLLGIRRSGDSLFYNINAYTDGSEVLIEDLLRKLPGIEVSSAGQVSYMGKVIDALMIGGNDLTGNRHFDITQNFQSDYLESVQIIENYISEFDIENPTVANEQVAMNIEIKKDKKGAIIGNFKANIGLNSRYLVKVNILKTTPNNGLSIFAGTTNHLKQLQGEETINAYTQDPNPVIGTNRLGFFDYVIYSVQLPDSKFAQNFIRLTETNRSNSIWSRRTFLNVACQNSESNVQYSKERFADQSSENSFHSINQSSFSAQFDHDSRFKLSPTITAIAKLKSNILLPGYSIVDTGVVDEQKYSLLSDADKKLIVLKLESVIDWAFHRNHTLKFYADYKFLSAKSEWSIVTNEPLFGYDTPNNLGLYSILYNDEYQQTPLTIGAEWTWSLNKTEIAFFTKHTNYAEEIKLNFSDLTVPDNSDFDLPVTEVGVKTKFKLKQLTVSGDLTLVRIDTGINIMKIAYRILPSIKLSHEIGKLSVLSLQFKRNERTPGLFHIHELPLIFDQRTLVTYGIFPYDFLSGWNGSITFKKKPGNHKNVFIAKLSANWMDKSLISFESVQESYFVRSGAIYPENKVFRILFFGWHTIYKWKINFNHFSAYTTGYSVANESYSELESYWTRTVLGITFKGFRGYELRASSELEFQDQTIDGISANWIRPIFSLGARYKNQTWEYSIEYKKSFTQTSDASLGQHILNFSLGYRKLQSFTISIEGVNILNMDSNPSLTSIINPVFSNTIRASRLPGSILIVGKYDF